LRNLDNPLDCIPFHKIEKFGAYLCYINEEPILKMSATVSNIKCQAEKKEREEYKMVFDEIKKKYQAYLHTPSGKSDLKVAMRCLKQWRDRMKDSVGTLTTGCVRTRNLPKSIADQMRLLEIEPIGLNNLCHTNADWFRMFGYDTQLGFNVLSCHCGKMICYELHTVNKLEFDGKKDTLTDFTRDFGMEKEKWFYPFQKTNLRANNFIQAFGDKHTCIQTDSGCTCFQVRSSESQWMTEKELVDFIATVEKCRVLG